VAATVTPDAERTDPPYRIETDRLVIRCWEPRDAPLIKEAIDSSLEHLQGWMPWALDEPKPLEQTVSLLRLFRGRFDLGEDFIYGIFSADERQALGGTGLHTRPGDGAFEIGYWIRASHVRQGLVTEAVAALTRVGFECSGVDRIEIRIDPENEASRGVPLKVGYVEEATLRRRLPPKTPGTPRRDAVIFTMLAEAYPSSPAASVRLAAYDAAGATVL
jgi:RimJ/RimL family protein N-acetyltransferase